MADKNLSGRPTAARPFANTDSIYMIQGGSTRRLPPTDIDPVGRHTISMPARAMQPQETNGATPGTYKASSSAPTVQVLDFVTGVDQYAEFAVPMPEGWDGGAVQFQADWTTTNTSTNTAAWGLQAVANLNNDPLSTAYGTPTVVVHANGGFSNRQRTTPISGNVAIAGNPAKGATVYFRVFRDVSADNMSQDASLIALRILFNIDAPTDD